MEVTIYYCLHTLFRTEVLDLIFVFLCSVFLFLVGFFFNYLDDQRSLTTWLFIVFFLVFVKFYLGKPLSVFFFFFAGGVFFFF